jgi:hypothetical protein
MNGYVPTPSLLDDAEGEALLNELGRLYSAIEVDSETNKKRRSGSRGQRHAIAALQAAMIKAEAQFAHHREFRTWLLDNGCEHIEAHDPLLDRVEMTDAIHNLIWRIEQLEKSRDGQGKLTTEIVAEIARLKRGSAPEGT